MSQGNYEGISIHDAMERINAKNNRMISFMKDNYGIDVKDNPQAE